MSILRSPTFWDVAPVHPPWCSATTCETLPLDADFLRKLTAKPMALKVL